jgi:hypothetical protein
LYFLVSTFQLGISSFPATHFQFWTPGVDSLFCKMSLSMYILYIYVLHTVINIVFWYFCQLSEKISAFLKKQCYGTNFAKNGSILNKNSTFFSPNFSAKIFKNHYIGPWSCLQSLHVSTFQFRWCENEFCPRMKASWRRRKGSTIIVVTSLHCKKQGCQMVYFQAQKSLSC